MEQIKARIRIQMKRIEDYCNAISDGLANDDVDLVMEASADIYCACCMIDDVCGEWEDSLIEPGEEDEEV